MTQHLRLLAALLALALLGGCDEAVDPILGTERVFTVYGYLDPTAARQAVRVYAIEGQLDPDTEPRPLDGAVRSVALATGAETVWRDSTVFFPDSTYGHVFHAAYTPAYGTDHRITVTRSDGRAAEVTVRTPPDVTPEILAPELLPVPILRVGYPGAPRLNEVVARYTVDGVTVGGEPFGQPGTYTFRHDGRLERTADGWTVRVPLLEDAQAIWLRYWGDGRPFGATLALREVTVEALVSSANWASPVGAYDPELLVEPGVFSNVENGFGFVGGGYRRGVTWLPDAEVLARAGLRPPPAP